jgi:deoxyribonuclease V
MLACVDVGYNDSAAQAACVTFEGWEDANPSGEYTLDIDQVEPYVPGQFYRRELPCLFAVLGQLPERPAVIVVDGYVWLDDTDRKGLGHHLYDALQQSVPVIGVAKTQFAGATQAVEIYRGSSARPLFVTAVGIEPDAAAEHIRRMHGNSRIPTLLKRVDTLSRLATTNDKE